MTGLKFEDPRFENASVEFDEAKLAPTYKLLWGVPGRSNALNIAERLGLDREVVQAARERLGKGVAKRDEAVLRLEAVQRQVEGREMAVWAVQQQVQQAQVSGGVGVGGIGRKRRSQ
jgi:dsDNA-specific endonuclease/ATPase MutS2